MTLTCNHIYYMQLPILLIQLLDLLRGIRAVLQKKKHSCKHPGCPEWYIHSCWKGGRESIWVLGTIPVWLTEMSSCVALQRTEPPLPNWPGHHLLASSIAESTIPLSALCHTAQIPFGLTNGQYQQNLVWPIFLFFFPHSPVMVWAFHPIFQVCSSPAIWALQLQGQNFWNTSLHVFPLVLNANVLYNPALCWGTLYNI